MALNVVLIDKSEITKKMISHCLHYYAAQVHRFENLEEMQSRFHQEQPDVVFVDWDLKQGQQPLAFSMKKQSASPLIVLHRGAPSESLNQMEHRLQKPIDANRLREMVVKLVPRTSQLKIHKFLKYPKKQPSFTEDTGKPRAESTQWESDEMMDLPNQEGVPMELINPSLEDAVSNASSPKEDSPVQKAPEAGEGGYTLPNVDKMEGYEIEKSSVSAMLSSKTREVSAVAQQKPVDEEKPSLHSAPPAKGQEPTQPKIFIKEDIDLDEDTANDFAPAALSNQATADVADTEQNREMILKILNEYKDTLEFESLMEKALRNYGDKMVKQIVAQDSRTIIQKAFSDYTGTPQFKTDMGGFLAAYLEKNETVKKQIEKTLVSFVRTQLPVLAKEIIETEIKKLLDEEG